MTIEEAIRTLKRLKKGHLSIGQFDEAKAIQMGIDTIEEKLEREKGGQK